MTEVRLVAEVPADVEAIGQWVFADDKQSWPHAAFLGGCGFTGQLGQAVSLPALPGGNGAVRIVAGAGARPRAESGRDTATGARSTGGLDAAVVRRAASALARAAGRYRRVALTAPVDEPAAVRAVVEGFLLAGYRFDRYRSSPDRPALERLDVVTGRAAGMPAEVAWAQEVASAVVLARDLGNEPGGALTPSVFAERAADLAARAGIGCDVWDEHRILGERLGGLLGVSRGSEQPPRLVRLDYRPAAGPAAATVALVGKGVTFDAGGLSLKPNRQMLDMKIDMAGAAVVLGALSALPRLSCPVRVVGWLPLTENMPGGGATRLGDVLRTRNGTTVEVRNADAEGRLILADALALAGEERPDAIVDIATLTAAVSMAVGRRYAGLAGNHDGWVAAVTAAARRAGEPVWPLPLNGPGAGPPRSRIADLANVPGGTFGQSVAAALFLREFVPAGIPWAHLDIFGPAFSDEDDGELVAGATGYGVRTLIELLLAYDLVSRG